MPARSVFKQGAFEVVDYCCTMGPQDRSYVELHDSYAFSYVRRGSFGYRYRGADYELVAGSVLLGRPGEEFLCTHEYHAHGDECLSFHFRHPLDEVIECSSEQLSQICESGSLPPLANTMVAGELSQSIVDGGSDVGLDEAGLLFAMRVAEAIDGKPRKSLRAPARDRRRAVEAALWIDAHSADDVDLGTVAHNAGLSSFHFLRLFSQVLGVSPHQYLVRSRVRKAAQLLADPEQSVTQIALEVGFADLSNFVRTFHRAAGMSPRAFRQTSRGERALITARFSKSLDR